MSKVNLNAYKGARDFYPEDKRLQDWMFAKWRKVVEGFGYQPYDAPILEPTDLYRMKGSDEIINEQTYTFEDRGGRSVTMRTEMTPTVSRMIAARRQELSYPARWYSIPNCWRYERAQRGRLREFWQLNVDLFGVESVDAEVEMLQIVDELFQAFKAKRDSYTIKINSRVLVNVLLEASGAKEELRQDIVRIIDKRDKLPPKAFEAGLQDATKNPHVTERVLKMLDIKSLNDLPDELITHESVVRLLTILEQMKQFGITNVEFDIALMRGFDYYTDIVFEVMDNSPDNNRAMFGGGRYDGLVGMFGVEPVATVGFGMGDITFQLFLEANSLIPKMKSLIDVRVLTTSPTANEQANIVASELREMGARVAVDYSGRKLDKQLKQADKAGVPYVLFVSDDEEADRYTLKNLKSGSEATHALPRIASIVCKS